MTALIVEASLPDNRELTEAINLETGNVVEIRYKGQARDFQKHTSAQDLLEDC